MDDGARGKCRRFEKLEAAARSGHLDARRALEMGPECPAALAYLFDLWKDIAQGREPGFERLHLTWPGLEAWERRRNVRLTQFEIDVLFALDNLKPAEHRPDD